MAWTRELPPCEHIDLIQEVEPGSAGCAECLAIGDTWFHLRLCLSCGNVGCCDQSKNTHARKHAGVSEHPIVRSFEVGETWRWCYPDSRFV
ncbi:MAG: UBP-type zinc finger domain-containing protein [Acidimicrobiia bacterium]